MGTTRARPQVPWPVLALGITIIWGFNFVVIKVGTDGVPPLLLAGLRFAFLAVPAVFFVPAPRAPWRLVAAYGLFLGVGEFGLLFTAIKLGAPAGLSSLILQAQAFFTALLGVVFLRERLRLASAVGMLIAAGGLVLIGLSASRPGAWGQHSGLALGMLLAAAAMWGIANVLAKRIGAVGATSLIVWSSLASPLPLFALSLAFEDGGAIRAAIMQPSWVSVGALTYLVLLSTLFGYGGWNHLIVEHGAGRVAPFSMLVPIFGVSSGALFLGETFSALHAWASLLVLLGLGLHVLGTRPR
jgi:O-acetylserine/cysteine efflux transporter